MPTFIGFNTIDQNKKFTAVDFDLIKIDLLNAFNIRQGELPGRPGYGTVLWNYLFENQTQETQAVILQEIQRVCVQAILEYSSVECRYFHKKMVYYYSWVWRLCPVPQHNN